MGVWQVDNGKAAWLDMYLSKPTKIVTNIETAMLYIFSVWRKLTAFAFALVVVAAVLFTFD